MRVVLDTNVIVAAFTTRGLCVEIFELCLKQTTLILSKPILEEVEKVFLQKFKLPARKVQEIRSLLESYGECVEPAVLAPNSCRDPHDVVILATAVAAGAKIIISGDEDLLVLKKFQNIPILSPREFWNLLNRK